MTNLLSSILGRFWSFFQKISIFGVFRSFRTVSIRNRTVLLLRCLSVFRLFKTTFVILQTMKSQLKILVYGMGWLFLVLFMAFYSSYYVLKIEPGHNTGMSMANMSKLDNTEPDEGVNSSPAKFFNLYT